MVGGPGLRFALEAAFLILLAVAAGLAELSSRTIVIVMGAAWLLVAAIEWLAWREGPRITRVRELSAQPIVEAPGLEPEPVAPRRDEDTADLAPPPEEPAAARVDDGSRT